MNVREIRAYANGYQEKAYSIDCILYLLKEVFNFDEILIWVDVNQPNMVFTDGKFQLFIGNSKNVLAGEGPSFKEAVQAAIDAENPNPPKR